MARYIWTARALHDLDRLRAFLAQKNPAASRRAVSAIRESVKVLAAQPGIGRRVEGYPPEYREWFIIFGSGGYIVRYRNEGEHITVLMLRHGKELQAP
ncbi:type II toxin-antitoxin system RelE/ParE family toxin [Dongia sp.]|uniref:type II toxin-antitoxin system RelE/ParE family toxin n=1 Tax=Dongia sp. TaxID=1977262 RepID=UPI003753D288